MEFPKTYRANLGWAMCVGAIVALLTGPTTCKAVVGLAVFGALGATWSSWEHGWLHGLLKGRRRPIVTLVVIWGLMSILSLAIWPSLPPKSPASAPQPPFSFAVGPIIGGIDMWLLDDNKTSLRVASQMVFVQIVNNQPKATMIDRVSAKGLSTATGKWFDLPLANTERSGIYWGVDVRDLDLVNMALLDGRLRDHNIGSGETVSGWLLFTMVPPIDFSKIELRLKDTAGTEYPSKPLGATPNEPGDLEWGRGFTIVTPHNDLSGLPILK